MNNFAKPTMLMILDGFGINENTKGNAIAAANTPNLDKIFASYPRTQLEASGLAVGLPDGQMGNSEVGHLNIGAGRIVYQELTKITKEIEEGSFFENETLLEAMKNAACTSDGRRCTCSVFFRTAACTATSTIWLALIVWQSAKALRIFTFTLP